MKTNTSWRTSTVGWIGLAMGLLAVAESLIKGETVTDTQWTLVGSLLVSNIGLLFAKDARVTGVPEEKP